MGQGGVMTHINQPIKIGNCSMELNYIASNGGDVVYSVFMFGNYMSEICCSRNTDGYTYCIPRSKGQRIKSSTISFDSLEAAAVFIEDSYTDILWEAVEL